MLDLEISPDLKMKYILHRSVIGGLENRSRENALAGEWIVYKPHKSMNYDFTLAQHAEPEEQIIERPRSCSAEFLELASILGRS